MFAGRYRLGFTIACVLAGAPAFAQGKAATVSESTEVLAERLAGQYAWQQMARLATLEDRDSLIAAALIGTPNVTEPEPEGHDEVLQRRWFATRRCAPARPPSSRRDWSKSTPTMP